MATEAGPAINPIEQFELSHVLPITVGAHISAKLAGSRQGKSNVTAVREAARVLAAQGSEASTRPR